MLRMEPRFLGGPDHNLVTVFKMLSHTHSKRKGSVYVPCLVHMLHSCAVLRQVQYNVNRV